MPTFVYCCCAGAHAGDKEGFAIVIRLSVSLLQLSVAIDIREPPLASSCPANAFTQHGSRRMSMWQICFQHGSLAFLLSALV